MRFFTPELLARSRSDNDDVATAAIEEWDRVTEKYREHLARIHAQLPESVREFVKACCLHDAAVIRLWKTGAGAQFHLLLGLDGNEVELSYDAPQLETGTHGDPGIEAKTPVRWLYDEFDVENGMFTHRILFSAGIEVTIKSYGFACRAGKTISLSPSMLESQLAHV